jgi:uncharacterized phage-like protein YoqJ
MERSKTVCFTGHRPNKIGGYNANHPQRVAVRDRLGAYIREAIDDGFDTFISGMALGIDMDAAEIVIKLREYFPQIKLIAAVPFEGQEGMWPAQSKRQWSDILAECDAVHYVCDPGYAAWKMQKRNEWMVDHAARVIAVWDGTAGGTGNCVNYACKAGHCEIIRIDPKEVR